MSSDGGVNWTTMTSDNKLSPRYDFKLAMFSDNPFKQTLFVVGGRNENDVVLNDIWKSEDAINW